MKEKAKKELFESIVKVMKKQIVNIVLTSPQKEVCKMIRGFLNRVNFQPDFSKDNLEMQEALYDISVNTLAMQLKSKNKDELYKEFSYLDKDIYKKLMDE